MKTIGSRTDKSKNYRMQDGFSLVEVILAVTILAIMTLPILAYFTNASLSSSKGKNTQRANLAGETVMEELNAVESFEELEGTPDPSATGTPGFSVTVDDSTNTAELVKDVTLDGETYHVIASVDYNYATKDSKGDEAYNAWKIPELKEVYTPENVVFEETDQAETALSEYYYENQTKEKKEILKGMRRVLCIDVEETADDGREVYAVSGYYRFYFGGADTEKTQMIKKTKIEKSRLQNIYVFYKVLNEEIQNEKAEVRFLNFANGEDIKNLNLYFLIQNTPASYADSGVEIPSGYKLDINNPASGTDNPNPFDITTAGNYNHASYFTNGILKAAGSTVVHFDSSVVDRKEGKRIASIAVDVYNYRDGSSYPESERLVHLESAKSSKG